MTPTNCSKLRSCLHLIREFQTKLNQQFRNYKIESDALGLLRQKEQLSRLLIELQTILGELMLDMPVRIERAREILGNDFVGPQEIDNIIGLNRSIVIPPIPYTLREIKRLKENNERLILRIDKDLDDRALTMDHLIELALVLTEGKNTRAAVAEANRDWELIKKEQRVDAFSSELPAVGWKIVSGGLFSPDIVSKDIVQQLDRLLTYFDDRALLTKSDLTKYRAMLEKTKQKFLPITSLAGFNLSGKQLFELMAALSKNKFVRNHLLTPVEMFYDFLMLGHLWSTVTESLKFFRTKRFITINEVIRTTLFIVPITHQKPLIVNVGLGSTISAPYRNTFALKAGGIEGGTLYVPGIIYQR